MKVRVHRSTLAMESDLPAKKVLGSSGGACLANRFRPTPDVFWIRNKQLAEVSLKQLVPIAPGFVIELRSSRIHDREIPITGTFQLRNDDIKASSSQIV